MLQTSGRPAVFVQYAVFLLRTTFPTSEHLSDELLSDGERCSSSRGQEFVNVWLTVRQIAKSLQPFCVLFVLAICARWTFSYSSTARDFIFCFPVSICTSVNALILSLRSRSSKNVVVFVLALQWQVHSDTQDIKSHVRPVCQDQFFHKLKHINGRSRQVETSNGRSRWLFLHHVLKQVVVPSKWSSATRSCLL